MTEYKRRKGYEAGSRRAYWSDVAIEIDTRTVCCPVYRIWEKCFCLLLLQDGRQECDPRTREQADYQLPILELWY